MLDSVNLNDKSYDELLAEAIARIPLYSKEWTNFNPSDPGVTMLQNLTAFQMLQQEAINNVSDEVKNKLLKLVGYTPNETRAATILVQAPPEGGPILPVGYQLRSGDVAFETTETVRLQPWGLESVYVKSPEGYRDVTRFLDDTNDTFVYPFGVNPLEENSFVCILSGSPEIGEPIRLWLKIAEEELRTPFGDETEIPAFSGVRWQYYTKDGWKNAEFEDETIGLLRSGAVTIIIEDDSLEIFSETSTKGYALRCVLEKVAYDRVPRVKSVAAHLFPMTQKETSVQCITAPGSARVAIRGRLPELGNIQVFCKEETNGAYRLYKKNPENGSFGRFFRIEENEWGATLYFDIESDFAPCEDDDAIRIVCYDNEMVHHRLLGPVYGYDMQTVKLDLVENVLSDSLLLILEKDTSDGVSEYWFVASGEEGPCGFSYHLKSKEAEIVIDEPGYSGCRLQLGSCACTKGARGNIRSGSILEQRGGYDGTEIEMVFKCPAPGRGGVSGESTEELRRRFSAGMQETTIAVKKEDFENIVRKTPGLCIHKVKAWSVQDKNLVRIAVKPYGEEKFPKLSKVYFEKICEYVEPRRLLTTRFEVISPRYIPIGVNVTVSVRGMISYAREEIEKLLRSFLDHIDGPGDFGEGIRFNEVYRKINDLPFVEAVDSLSVFPEKHDASMQGSDIILGEDSLCYPGTIRIEIREYGR